MAMGRLQMTNIERLAAERLAGGDEVSRAAIQAVLHEHRTGCRLGKDCSPDGEETSRLFAAWPDVALLLSVGPEEPLYRAVMGMAKLLKDLYHTYQVGTRPQCRAAAASGCIVLLGPHPITSCSWRRMRIAYWTTFGRSDWQCSPMTLSKALTAS